MNNSQLDGVETEKTTRHVIQGSHFVSSNPKIVLATILGSCVSACMWDPVEKVGGMNHFLLARGANVGADGHRYGSHAMELLINDILKRGGMRERLHVKLFGGAVMQSVFSHIGAKNAEFPLKFVHDEGFNLVSHSLLGVRARRVKFNPTNGSAQQKYVENNEVPVFSDTLSDSHNDVIFF